MDSRTLKERLNHIKASDDFAYDSRAVAEEARTGGLTLEVVRAVFEFMEDNPSVDYGTPGALVHLVEELDRASYEVELLDSVSRRPVSHTLWMLNRVINGTEGAAKREKLIEAMREAGRHPRANADAKRDADEFLRRVDGALKR